MGDWSDGANTGFCGTATYERSFTPNITGQVYAGYISFGGDEAEGFSYSYAMIPILVGAKYFFQPGGKGFYGNALLGFHMFTADVSVPDEFAAYYSGGSETSTEFSFGIGAGYELPMGKNALDLTAHYMLVSDANYIGVRVAYRFGL
jgi:hypothetical protein